MGWSGKLAGHWLFVKGCTLQPHQPILVNASVVQLSAVSGSSSVALVPVVWFDQPVLEIRSLSAVTILLISCDYTLYAVGM